MPVEGPVVAEPPVEPLVVVLAPPVEPPPAIGPHAAIPRSVAMVPMATINETANLLILCKLPSVFAPNSTRRHPSTEGCRKR